VGLGRHKWLLDDRYSTNGTYRSILTMLILGAFQRVAMTVGNNGGGVHNLVLHTRDDDGVGTRDIMADGRNGWICVDCKRLLEAGS